MPSCFVPSSFFYERSTTSNTFDELPTCFAPQHWRIPLLPQGKTQLYPTESLRVLFFIPRTLDVIGAYIDDIRREKMTTVNTNMYVLCFSNVMEWKRVHIFKYIYIYTCLLLNAKSAISWRKQVNSSEMRSALY